MTRLLLVLLVCILPIGLGWAGESPAPQADDEYADIDLPDLPDAPSGEDAGPIFDGVCTHGAGGAGIIHAYPDELSQQYAGANGSHRMKEALNIVKLAFQSVAAVDVKNLPSVSAGVLSEIRFQGGDIDSQPPVYGEPPEVANPLGAELILDATSSSAVDHLHATVQLYATQEIFEFDCVETGADTMVFRDSEQRITVSLSAQPVFNAEQRDSFAATVVLDKDFIGATANVEDESDYLESDVATNHFLEVESAATYVSRARPSGILASLGSLSGVESIGGEDMQGYGSSVQTIPEEFKSRIRYEDATQDASFIYVDVHGKNSMGTGPEVRQVRMNKIGSGIYESEKLLVAYNGSLEESVRANLEEHFGLLLIHNPEITAVIGNTVTSNGTYEVFVNVDEQRPNILLADGQSTTEVVFRDTAKKAGIKVVFTTDKGAIDGGVKVTDANGVAKATYTADNKTSMATVKAKVVGEDLTLNTLVYNEAYNFLDLSQNAGMAGYTDDTFVRNDALDVAGIQQLLVVHKSFLATYSEGGLTAAQIIKAAADANKVNPKVIVVTLEKEQGLVTQRAALDPSSERIQKAMGANGANGFSDQVNAGTKILRRRFDQEIKFFPIVVKVKHGKDGKATEKWKNQNHIYVVPDTGVKNVWASVAFRPLNKSTNTQHIYTNYVTWRPDDKAKVWPLPGGGVYTFITTWKRIIGE